MMAVFSKNRAPNTTPRCEVETRTGRCKFHGARYVQVGDQSIFCCSRHAEQHERRAK